MTNTTPRIAIIGAGPAGATLARILHLNKIPFELFEGEASSSIRTQGSTLDLHAETGQAALKACDLWKEFTAHARYDGEANRFADKNYKIYLESTGGSAERNIGRPEIDRTALRQILIDSLPAGAVQWGRRVREVDAAAGVLRFHGDADGNGAAEAGPFDLIVGADGAWSKVRPHLTDDTPYYTGLGGIGLTIEDPATAHPDLDAQVRRGSLLAAGDGKVIVPQQLGAGPIFAYTWSRRAEDWMQTCGFDATNDTAAARKHLADVYRDWHPALHKFTQVASGPMQPRNLYMLPVGNRWTHRAGLTLLGDAAHLMTPFAGEGVNLAMADAMDLANAIVKAASKGTLDAHVRDFEEAMFVRAKPIQQETQDNMDAMLADNVEVTIPQMIDRILEGAPAEIIAQIKKTDLYGP